MSQWRRSPHTVRRTVLLAAVAGTVALAPAALVIPAFASPQTPGTTAPVTTMPPVTTAPPATTAPP